MDPRDREHVYQAAIHQAAIRGARPARPNVTDLTLRNLHKKLLALKKLVALLDDDVGALRERQQALEARFTGGRRAGKV